MSDQVWKKYLIKTKSKLLKEFAHIIDKDNAYGTLYFKQINGKKNGDALTSVMFKHLGKEILLRKNGEFFYDKAGYSWYKEWIECTLDEEILKEEDFLI